MTKRDGLLFEMYCEQEVPLCIVEENEGTASKDCAQTPHQTSWNEQVSVDRLAMAVHAQEEVAVQMRCYALP